jgi:hypothetical protein
LGSALVGGLLAAVVLAARFAFSDGQTRARTDVLGIVATRQPVTVQVGTQPTAASTGTAAPSSATPALATNDRAHVAHTDGQGVVLRASPRDDDRTPRGFMEGDAVTILERSGSDWTRVRGDNGQEGWVPTSYLGP